LTRKEPLPVALITDFGLNDAYVGIMKAVISTVSPRSRIIDITHGIAPQNIFHGAMVLEDAFAYFPQDTIFCAVVDPGVGSERKPVCIKTTRYCFVGPGNGVLWKAASTDGIQQIIHLDRQEFFLQNPSNTFHGRDLFAPVCAHISKGTCLVSHMGTVIDACVRCEPPQPVFIRDALKVTVLYVDHFGNIAVNLSEPEFCQFVKDQPFSLHFKTATITKMYRSYSQAQTSECFLIPSSSGRMEISMKNAHAATHLNARPMDTGFLKTDG